MAETLTTYDPAECLTSDLAIGTFMSEAFETGDSGYIAHALGVVAEESGGDAQRLQVMADQFVQQARQRVRQGHVQLGALAGR